MHYLRRLTVSDLWRSAAGSLYLRYAVSARR